jgi:hypothetical protein
MTNTDANRDSREYLRSNFGGNSKVVGRLQREVIVFRNEVGGCTNAFWNFVSFVCDLPGAAG